MSNEQSQNGHVALKLSLLERNWTLRINARTEQGRNRKIDGRYFRVYWDGISRKRVWGGEVRNGSILVAVGGGGDGYRDIPGIAEGGKMHDTNAWTHRP